MKTPEIAPPARSKRNAAAAPRKNATATAARPDVTRSVADHDKAAEGGQGVYQRIAPQKLWRSATNRTVEKDEEYERLRENIREHGILQPLVVRPLPAGEWFIDPGTRGKEPGYFVTCRPWVRYVNNLGKPGHEWHPVWSQFHPEFCTDEAEARERLPEYEIVIGEHRWTAAMELELAEVPIILRSIGDREAILLQLSENLRRKHLKPLDEARGYQRMLDLGMTVEEIGKELGSAEKELGKSTIYARLQLLKLPESALNAVAAGVLPASHAGLLAKVEDPGAQEKLCKLMLAPKEIWANGKMIPRDAVSFREAEALADEAAKEEAREKAWQKQAQEFSEKGYKVLTIAQSGAVFKYGSMLAGYVGVTDECNIDPERRTWKALLGTHAPQVIAAFNSWGSKARLVYARKAAEKGLRAAGHAFADPGAASPKVSAEKRREEEAKKQLEEQERKFIINAERIGKVVAAAEAREPNADYLRMIVECVWDAGCEGTNELLRRRGVEVPEQRGWDWGDKQMQALIAKADGKTLRGLLLELFLWSFDGAHEDLLKSAAKSYGVKLQTSGKKKAAAAGKEEDDATI